MHQTHEARALFQIYPVKTLRMWSHVKPLSAHLLCYVRFRQTEDATGTVKTQLLCCHLPPPPHKKKKNSRLRKQADQDGRLWRIGTQPDNLPARFGSAVAQSPLSPLSFTDSYLLVRRRTGQRERVRERESCNTCLHLQGLLTWLMKQLTQWLTPVHWVTKKSPGRPEMVRYWFLLFPQRNPPLSPCPRPYDHEEEIWAQSSLSNESLIYIFTGVTLHLITLWLLPRIMVLYSHANCFVCKKGKNWNRSPNSVMFAV